VPQPPSPRDLASLPGELRRLLAVGGRLEETNRSVAELSERMNEVKDELRAVKEDTSVLPALNETMGESARHSAAMRGTLDEMAGHMATIGELRSALDEANVIDRLPELIDRLPSAIEHLSEQLDRLMRTIDRLSETTEGLEQTTGRLADGTAPLRALAERFDSLRPSG
jgi:chromosome segregation ATPase